MLYFPQLRSGALVQYPIRVKDVARTIVTESPGGDLVRMADPYASQVRWTLRLTGLSDGERAAIEDLYEACRGPLREFVFLDPLDNLLSASERLDEAPWVRDPLLVVETGGAAPGSCTIANLINTGQIEQTLHQTAGVPGELTYSFSFRLRAGTVRAEAVQGTIRTEQTFSASTGWAECRLGVALMGEAVGVRFGLSVLPGATVEVCGLQVDAQSHPSPYKPTAGAGGVYPYTRLAGGTLQFVANGVGNHDVTLELVSRTER